MVMIMNEKEKLNMKELLRSNIVEVTFTKVNGEKRVMQCTLIESYLPPPSGETQENTEKTSDTSMPVWDIGANGWRSFRYDNVISFGIKGEMDV